MARNVTTTKIINGGWKFPLSLLDMIEVECPNCNKETKIKISDNFKAGKRRCSKCYQYYNVRSDANGDLITSKR